VSYEHLSLKLYPPDKNQAIDGMISRQAISQIITSTWTSCDISGLVIGTTYDDCHSVLSANQCLTIKAIQVASIDIIGDQPILCQGKLNDT
jgi:hypothetical protein